MATSPSINDGLGATLPTQPVGWQGGRLARWLELFSHKGKAFFHLAVLPPCQTLLRARTRPHTGEVRMQNREQHPDAGAKASCMHLPSKGGAGDEGG
jgi:hypothetical protein